MRQYAIYNHISNKNTYRSQSFSIPRSLYLFHCRFQCFHIIIRHVAEAWHHIPVIPKSLMVLRLRRRR